jgi:hypothetical protein
MHFATFELGMMFLPTGIFFNTHEIIIIITTQREQKVVDILQFRYQVKRIGEFSVTLQIRILAPINLLIKRYIIEHAV